MIGHDETSLKGSITVKGENMVQSVVKIKHKINENIDSVGLSVDVKEQKQTTLEGTHTHTCKNTHSV